MLTNVLNNPAQAGTPGSSLAYRFQSVPLYPLLLTILLATSSIVLIEPAPYDVIAMGLFVTMYALGLRIPGGLGVPLIFWTLLLFGNLVSIMAAAPESGASIPEMTTYVGTTAYLIATWLLIANLTFLSPGPVLKAIWTGYLIAVFIAVLAALAGYFNLIPGADQFTLYGRGRGTFKDPNVYGPFLIPAVIYLMHGLLERWTWTTLLKFGLLSLLLAGLLISFSRGAWGNLALSCFVYLVLRILTANSPQQAGRLLMATVPAVLAMVVTVLVVATTNDDVGTLLAQRTQFLQDYDAGRFNTQAAALQESLSQPLGVGPNRTHKVFGLQPHNVYIKIFSDNGWIGGFAFLLLMLLTLYRGFRSSLVRSEFQAQTIIVYSVVVGTLAESVIIDTLHWRHLFLLLGMLWGLIILQDQARKTPRDADTRTS